MRARAAAGRNRATIQPVDTVSTWPARTSHAQSRTAAASRPQRSTSITHRRNQRSSRTSDSANEKPKSRRWQCTFTLQASAWFCASSPLLRQQSCCERVHRAASHPHTLSWSINRTFDSVSPVEHSLCASRAPLSRALLAPDAPALGPIPLSQAARWAGN